MCKKETDRLFILLEQAQNQKEYATVAGYYLELGKAYQEEGKRSKAIYYFNRFDNLVGGDDSLYSQFQEEDDMAMDWITALEAEQEPYEKAVQRQVAEKAACLTELQKMQWLVLTLSRFCLLFRHISTLPGFEGFEKLDKMVDYFCEGLYREADEDWEEDLDEYINLVDEVFDSILMSDYSKKLSLPGRADFVPADLESGDIGTSYFSMAYYSLQAYLYGELEEDTEMAFTACGILADYYYRTSDTEISEQPKIQEETERIFSDYDFITKEPDQEEFRQKITNYKKIMLV